MKRKIASTIGPLRWLFCTLLFTAAVVAIIATIGPVGAVSGVAGANQKSAINKIAPWVFEHTANGAQAEFLVILADQTDLSAAKALPTKKEKGRFVRDALWQKAQTTQQPILRMLRARGVSYRSFYIVNMIWVKGDYDLALELAARPDVARIEGNPVIRNVQNPLPVTEVSIFTGTPQPFKPSNRE